jgi:hypothetical protein
MARKLTKTSVENLVLDAKSIQAGADIYANYVRVTAAMHEFTLDFYRLAPALGRNRTPEIIHLQRVTVPANLAKGLVSAISEVIDHYENEFGLPLINDRDLTLPSNFDKPENE